MPETGWPDPVLVMGHYAGLQSHEVKKTAAVQRQILHFLVFNHVTKLRADGFYLSGVCGHRH